MNRRTFAKILLGASPFTLLSPIFQAPLLNIYRRFYKGERAEMKTYVMFNMFGAPVRWIFDNNYRPHGNDEHVFHSTIFTGFADTEADHYNPFDGQLEYGTVPYKNLHVPKLWSSNVFFRDKLVPMTGILEHMLTIRGVKQGIDAHPAGNVRQICVRSGDMSISGLVASSSSRPIPALCLGVSPASNAFYSGDDRVVQLEIPYQNSSPDNNILHFLTRPFLEDDSSAQFSREVASESKDDLLKIVKNSPVTVKLPKGFDPIQEYDRIFGKYSKIINETLTRCPIKNFTDKPMLVEDFSATSEEELKKKLSKFVFEGDYLLTHNYSKTLEKIKIGFEQFIEKQFTLAEFVVLNKISSSIVLSPPTGREFSVSKIEGTFVKPKDLKIVREKGLYKVDLEGSKPRFQDGCEINFDSHLIGSFYVVLGASLYWQCFSACMMEFVQTMKDHSTVDDNIFAEMVIHLASEFDRAIPTEDGKTNHLESANPTSLISGMIDDYKVIGNILVNSKYNGNACTLGEAAPVKEFKNQIVQTEHVLSSITTILGGRELSFRHPALLKLKNNRIVTAFKAPKNIGNS
jgi:hypothetical protein